MKVHSHTNPVVPWCQIVSSHSAPHFVWEWTPLCGNEGLITVVPASPQKRVQIPPPPTDFRDFLALKLNNSTSLGDMDLGMAPFERACLICISQFLVWHCYMCTCHRIQVNFCESHHRMGTCFVGSVTTRLAMTTGVAESERVHLICIFRYLVFQNMMTSHGSI